MASGFRFYGKRRRNSFGHHFENVAAIIHEPIDVT